MWEPRDQMMHAAELLIPFGYENHPEKDVAHFFFTSLARLFKFVQLLKKTKVSQVSVELQKNVGEIRLRFSQGMHSDVRGLCF